MKRISLFLLALVFTITLSSVSFSQGYHAISASTETIAIADSGTLVNGTTVFNNHPYISIRYMVYDTLSSDSAQAHIYIGFAESSTGNFAFFDTLTTSTDSTWFIAEYGPDEHPMLPFIRFSAQGDTTTSNIYNLVNVRADGFYMGDQKNSR